MFESINENQFDLVWAIEQQAFQFPWTKAHMMTQLKRGQCNFGLYQDGQLLAYILLQKIFPEVEILNIAVAPNAQNKKWGRTLLLQTMAHLIAQKYERIYLEVRVSNQFAIRLYESLGFNQMGERKNYYPKEKNTREDALLYGKELC